MQLCRVQESNIHSKGAFAIQDIEPETVIIEYTGELITKEEENRREKENEKVGITYILSLDQNYAIDGAIGGNDSIYFNHFCDPNCKVVQKGDRAFFVAQRNIKKGEELTLDYAYDKNDKKEECFCGSVSCRGFLNEN